MMLALVLIGGSLALGLGLAAGAGGLALMIPLAFFNLFFLICYVSNVTKYILGLLFC